MLEPTRKSGTTDYVEIKFRIPSGKVDEIIKVVAQHGGQESSVPIPWREVFPDFNPGVALRGGRKKEGLTQKDLARLIGVSKNRISDIEHGKLPIGKEMAKRLGGILKVDYRVFL
ncbi:helix-turn-helix domain-containing protein [Desulfobacca acetoxidans]